MKEVYYWSPCLSKVGTTSSTINSAIGLSKYGKYSVKIINSCGEWDLYKKKFSENKIDVIDFPIKLFKYLPKEGFIGSRISYIIIFLFSFFPLLRLIKKSSPEFLIIHLISSLPLFLLSFFKFETKFILRISGFPKLSMFRKILWKITLNKIHAITCPTELTKNYIVSLKLVDKNKIYVLPDPIIDIAKIMNLKKAEPEIYKNKEYIFAAGRLTRQKNFSLMIDAFSRISEEHKNLLLIIAGEGEDELFLKKKVKKLNLNEKIIFLGFSKNVFNFMSRSICFLSTSLWEDPGFVLIEAGFCRSTIISSDCKSGPEEILMDGKSGYLFQSNNLESLVSTLKIFINDKKKNKNLYQKKINLLKYIKRFTIFRHSSTFKKILLP